VKGETLAAQNRRGVAFRVLARAHVDAWNRCSYGARIDATPLGFQVGTRATSQLIPKSVCCTPIMNILYLFWSGDLRESRLRAASSFLQTRAC